MLPTKQAIEHILNARMMTIMLLGFSSGLPLALSTGTLQAWLADVDVNIRSIGWFSLAGLPYTLKFIWSPLMDRFVPNNLGRRRGWMFLTQCALLILITVMGLLTPDEHLKVMGMVAFFIAFLSASQDIAFDAYRTDILPANERGFGAAVSVGGYRIAMLVSGAGALIIAGYTDWKTVYFVMAGLMLIGMTTSYFCHQPADSNAPKTLQDAVIKPFFEFINRPSAILLLVLIVLYKLGDAFAGTLTTAFLIQALDFSTIDVGLINKGFGIVATLVGLFYGGVIMMRLGLYRSLLWFGILQAITNLGFMVLAIIGKSYIGMMTVIGLENLSGGMGTAAFVALIMALCNHKYTATQFALLSSLAAIGRVFVGPPSGEIVAVYGWVTFFMLTFFIALPGLYLLTRLKVILQQYDIN